MLRSKIPSYPYWAAPYTATWEGDQWIIRFPDEESALYALRSIRLSDKDKLFPMLAVAPHPGGGAGWYIGQVHP